MDYGLRYDAKRAAGISEFRSDGSRTNRKTDEQAGAAERYAADFFNVACNDEIYSNHGDGGKDFYLQDVRVDVVHLGILGDGTPRTSGNLIINPHEPWRHATIYLVVRGSIQTRFELIGWYIHDLLIQRPKRNFGYGERYWCPLEQLYPISWILDAVKSGT